MHTSTDFIQNINAISKDTPTYRAAAKSPVQRSYIYLLKIQYYSVSFTEEFSFKSSFPHILRESFKSPVPPILRKSFKSRIPHILRDSFKSSAISHETSRSYGHEISRAY